MEETMEKEPQLTQEQIEDNKQKLMVYYENNIPFLKLQRDYEQLITEIQESKTRRLIAQIQFAQIVAPQEEPEKEEKKEPSLRTLRKD